MLFVFLLFAFWPLTLAVLIYVGWRFTPDTEIDSNQSDQQSGNEGFGDASAATMSTRRMPVFLKWLLFVLVAYGAFLIWDDIHIDSQEQQLLDVITKP